MDNTQTPSEKLQKVILISQSGYLSGHAQMLRRLLLEGLGLLFVIGKDSQRFEQVMDGLVIQQIKHTRAQPFVISFSNIPLYQLISMALAFPVGLPNEIRVIKL